MAFIAGVAAMAALVALAYAHPVFPGDEWALLELRQWRQGGWTFAIGVMYYGWPLAASLDCPTFPIGIVIFAGIARTAERRAVHGGVPASCRQWLNLGLKELAARPRPDAALALVEETGYAFPSSHYCLCRRLLRGADLPARASGTLSLTAPRIAPGDPGRADTVHPGHWRVPRVLGGALAQRCHRRLPVRRTVPRGAGNRAPDYPKEALGR